MNNHRNRVNRSIAYLKKVDYLLGPGLVKICAGLKKKKNPPIADKDISNILVIRPGGIGDAALLLPSLKTLKQRLPSASIHVLCEKRNRGVFTNSPWISSIIDYQSLRDCAPVFLTPYDLIIDTEQSHYLTTVLVSLLKSKQKAGFATLGRGDIYDISVSYSHAQYEVDSFFKLFRSVLNSWPEKFAWDHPYIIPGNSERTRIKALLGGIMKPVCIFPGASIPERRWPVRKWAQLIRSLKSEGFEIVLVGGKGELEICRAIKHETGIDLPNFAGKLSLLETTSLFERSSLLISTDSGILHLGVICDLPTVSLFGPGIAAKWGPKGDIHIVISKGLECSPCTRFGETPPCPRNAECIKEISISEVLDAALTLLKREHDEALGI